MSTRKQHRLLKDSTTAEWLKIININNLKCKCEITNKYGRFVVLLHTEDCSATYFPQIINNIPRHPNIDDDGYMCITQEDVYEDEEWHGELYDLLWAVNHLLLHPGFDDPLNSICMSFEEYEAQFN